MFDNDLNYAKTRIVDTWLLDSAGKEGLFYISEITSSGTNSLEDGVIHVKDTKGKSLTKNIKDLRFNIGSLGWVNDRYLSRVPLRNDWRQGLRHSQVMEFTKDGSGFISSSYFYRNIEGVSKAALGVYPSFHSALDQVEEEGLTNGFSKHFAVTSNYKLAYKGIVVGKITSKDSPELDSNYEFLEQELKANVY